MKPNVGATALALLALKIWLSYIVLGGCSLIASMFKYPYFNWAPIWIQYATLIWVLSVAITVIGAILALIWIPF